MSGGQFTTGCSDVSCGSTLIYEASDTDIKKSNPDKSRKKLGICMRNVQYMLGPRFVYTPITFS